MRTDRHSMKRFTAVVRSNEDAIKRIGALFYPPDTYCYKALVSDLTTYLWLVYRDLPEGFVIHNECAWIFTVLYRHASSLVRQERNRQARLVYDADITNIADVDTNQSLTRLYRLIDKLEGEDEEIITLYLGKVPVREIAARYDMSPLKIYRRINSIGIKLRRLNAIMEDEDEF